LRRKPIPKSLAPDLIGAELKWPSVQARAWVLSFANRACSDANTEALVLIGSIARPVSYVTDVDLLYVYREEPLRFLDHPLDVDIRAYEKSQFSQRLVDRHDVVTWALRFGRVICQRGRFWNELVDSFAGTLPLPRGDVAQERAKRAAAVYEQLLQIGDAEAALEQRISLLTHQAWSRLLQASVHPASRPELPQQLRSVGEFSLASDIAAALSERAAQQSPRSQAERRVG
jgi:hypothetical protein